MLNAFGQTVVLIYSKITSKQNSSSRVIDCKEKKMNARNRQKKWYKYCLDSKVLDKNGNAELRMTKDVADYNPSMYVIIIFDEEGGIEETISENIYSKAELLKIWESWKD